MDAGSIDALVLQLFSAIQLIAGYPTPQTVPEIHRVAVEVMQQKICGRPCPVKAFYHPDWGVYVDEKLDVFGDVFDRSVLLDELVHHAQHTSGKFTGVPGRCHRRNAEELEAYEIQNRYLAREYSSRRSVFPGWPGQCRDEAG